MNYDTLTLLVAAILISFILTAHEEGKVHQDCSLVCRRRALRVSRSGKEVLKGEKNSDYDEIFSKLEGNGASENVLMSAK